MGDNSSDDPFGPRDGTIMRPRPGGARRGVKEPTLGDNLSAPPQGVYARSAAVSTSSGSGSLSDFLGAGRNPILQAAAPLLTLAARLQSNVQQANVSTLRQQAVHEIRLLEDRLHGAGISPEDVLVARYVLCTFVDAAVSNTPWGAQSDWSRQSLLVIFHKEVSGGEKFFQILDRVSANPSRYLDLIELLYVCLALGYEGKYRLDREGQAHLTETQHGLYRLIREQRQIRDEPLSAHWQGVKDRRNPVFRYVPWWIVAAAGAAALVIVFFVFHTKLRTQAEPIKSALSLSSAPVEYAAAAAPPRENRLRQLLATEESAGRLTVEEFDEKTLVTFTAPDLFKSGSARVNPALYSTIRRVGAALNDVPGRVFIIGHTDDQPVRSFQFADNFELSRERAVAVAEIVKPTMENFGRIEWSGVGSTQPRFQPASTPESRARNRRVEIIHIPSAEPSP